MADSKPVISFRELIDHLEYHYGVPKPPATTNPLELIIWENIAYLSDDKRRAAAFEELKGKVSTEPDKILKADRRKLVGITKAGILADLGVEKLLTIARTAYEEFNGDLWPVVKLPLLQAKKALKRFPGIGDPGAEKIFRAAIRSWLWNRMASECCYKSRIWRREQELCGKLSLSAARQCSTVST